MQLTQTEKVQSVISMSNHAYEETKRYRDHVWKILIWSLGLLVGFITAVSSNRETAATCSGKWIGSIFVLIVAGFGIFNIFFNYRQFVWNRNLVRQCERFLQFYKVNMYPEITLLKKSWATEDYKFMYCLIHFFQWVILISAVAAYSIYMIIKVQ